MTILEARTLLDARKISPTELAREYTERAKALNSKTNAVITFTDGSSEAGRQTDETVAKNPTVSSPLRDIPYVLKDNISTKGILTSCASKMLSNYVPFYNAFVYDALTSCGAVLIGKTNMDEFAMGSTSETSCFGPVHNPRNLSRVPGGSSGGSASAVASGAAVFAIGSDTGGSIRQPAAFCGAVGLKPTYGAVSRRGLIAYASSLDQIGPIAQTVRDAGIVFDAIALKDNGDMTSRGAQSVSDRLTGDVRGMRVGIAREFYENLPSDIAARLQDAAKTLEKNGAVLTEISFPRLKDALPAYYILACAEASSNLARFDGIRYGYHTPDATVSLDDFIRRTRTEGFGEEVRRRILLGTYVLSAGYYDAYYGKAQLVRRAVAGDFRKLFESVDILLTPTAPTSPPEIGAALSPVELYQTDICTVPVNIAGLPGVSVPCGRDNFGMPVGAQIIGKAFSEATILNAALAIENEIGSFSAEAGSYTDGR